MKNTEIEMLLKEGEGLTMEFKENPSGRIAETITAFSNTKGGRILIGVNDASTITGYKLANKDAAVITSIARNCSPAIDITVKQAGKIAVISVPEGMEKPYSCSSGYFRRLDAVTQKMNQKEISAMYRDNIKAGFEELTNSGARIKDLSLEKINNFLRLSDIDLKVTKISLVNFLDSFSLLADKKLKNVAVLMFAKNPGKFILQAQIAMFLFKDHNKVEFFDRKNFRGDLLEQYNEAMAFLEKHLNRRTKIIGRNRVDTYEIPIEAVREAVANAIIHRDYSVKGTDITIELYPDTLEISNPGGLPDGMSKSDLGKKSVRRNEIISDLFYRMDKIEKAGTGIKRINEALKKAGLKSPEFESTGFFTMIFSLPNEYNQTDKDMENVPEKGVEKGIEKGVESLPDAEKKIIELIEKNPAISKKHMVATGNLSKKTIEYNLEKLKRKGLIKRVGPDKGGYWEVVKPRTTYNGRKSY